MDKVKELLQSRKFWALVLGLLAIIAGYSTGKLDAWQAIQAGVAALAVYGTGIALVDASANIGAGISGSQAAPAQPAQSNIINSPLPAPGGDARPTMPATPAEKLKNG